jgi:perosamine synthetase
LGTFELNLQWYEQEICPLATGRAHVIVPAVRIAFSEADRADILARIDACLSTGQMTQGRNVSEFEELFRAAVGSRHAIAVNSGGGALEVAMQALDIRGKDVIIPTNTFIATAAAVRAAGGNVVLVDIDASSAAPNVAQIREVWTENTAGVILVHIGGLISPQMGDIRAFCDSRDAWLFEDCAHAHGSSVNGISAGRFGIGGAYSFFSTKVVTCGEGGMVITDDDGLADRIRGYRNYGKPEPWVSVSTMWGGNYRLNEIAAAVGVVQMKRLPDILAKRAAVAARYVELLRHVNSIRVMQPAGTSGWYKFIVRVPSTVMRAKIREVMVSNQIALPGNVYDVPLHRQPVWPREQRDYPQATSFCDEHLCLPLYTDMTDDDIYYVVHTFLSALRSHVET